jgi:hypothetical protein
MPPDADSPAASGGRGTQLWRAAAACCLVLLALEGGARLLHRAMPTPSSWDAPRNPHHRRGWIDYTAPPRRRPPGPSIVLISSSQGFLRESSDPSQVYARRLEELLRARSGTSGPKVLNWSLDGGSALEAVLLAARAVQHEPEVLLFVTSPGVFRPHSFERPPSYWASDAWQLCHLDDVRAVVPSDLLALCDRERLRGLAATRLRSSWARSRLFGPQMDHWQPWPASGELATERPRKEARRRDVELSEPDLVRTLQQIHDVLSAHAPAIRLVFVAGPLHRDAITEESWPLGARMLELARRELRADHLVLDARDVVAGERFYDMVHFDRVGHQDFAEWLAPRLAPLLERSTLGR